MKTTGESHLQQFPSATHSIRNNFLIGYQFPRGHYQVVKYVPSSSQMGHWFKLNNIMGNERFTLLQNRACTHSRQCMIVVFAGQKGIA